MLRAIATNAHRLRRSPRPMTVCLILGLLLGVNTSLIMGEGLIEEITLGTLGGLIGGALYTLVGGRDLKFLGLSAMVGALVLIIVFDVVPGNSRVTRAVGPRRPLSIQPDAVRQFAALDRSHHIDWISDAPTPAENVLYLMFELEQAIERGNLTWTPMQAAAFKRRLASLATKLGETAANL